MSDSVSSSLAKAKSSLSGKTYEVKTKAKLLIPKEREEFQKSLKGDYERVRGKLQRQIDRAVLSGNGPRVEELTKRIERLEKGAGAKLKMPRTQPVSSEREIKLRQRKQTYAKTLDRLLSRMEQAAKRGNLGTYDKLEKTLMLMQSKAAKDFRPNDYIYNRREIWNESYNKDFRGRVRRDNYVSARSRMVDKLNDAAREGDRKEYVRLEKALAKVQERAGEKIGYKPSDQAKGEVWARARIIEARSKVLDKMVAAITSENRAEYDRLERRLARFEDKLGMRAGYSSKPGSYWSENIGLAKLSKRLEEGGIKNGRDNTEGIKLEAKIGAGNRMIDIESRVMGHKVNINVSPDSLSFKVNDSYTSKSDLPRRDTVAITREIMRQFDIVASSLRDGTVLQVSAARGDGREDMRENAYIKFGFSPPDKWGDMFGRVENGKIVPIDGDEFNAGHSARFKE